MKKTLRDIPTGVLMIIVISLLFFLSINVADFIQKMKIENESIVNYEYSYSMSCSYNGEYDGNEAEKALENIFF